ncbi:MAG: aspartate ammonia-lyase [Planctomycetota bacterium]
MRREHDLLGERELAEEALHGIHAERARENFPLTGRPVHPALIRAYGAVKQACAQTNHELGHLDAETAAAIGRACEQMRAGQLDQAVIVDALQGGAGTSTNMNVNEVIANRALQLLGHAPGDYTRLDPHAHVNLHQSTNDTFPTALKVAALDLLDLLEERLVALQETFQERERALAGVVKVGRTQLQDACLITLGREMGAYGEACGRDRWRVFKCRERLRVVNLGGTAIGTGLGAPRRFIFRATDALRALVGHGLARAENLVDNTQNCDVYTEVGGILKACAVNLCKIAGDLRLLASGPDAGFAEIHLPARQAGSSIMPGKVNPVIPEAVMQAAMQVMANDQAIAMACSRGELELNAFLPLVADNLLGGIDLLTNAADILARHCVAGITPRHADCGRVVDGATAALTALVPIIGYAAAEAIAASARRDGCGIRAAALASGLIAAGQYDQLITPAAVNRLGSPPAAGDRR